MNFQRKTYKKELLTRSNLSILFKDNRKIFFILILTISTTDFSTIFNEQEIELTK